MYTIEQILFHDLDWKMMNQGNIAAPIGNTLMVGLGAENGISARFLPFSSGKRMGV